MCHPTPEGRNTFMLIFRAAWALCRTFTMLQIKGISQLTRQRCSPCMPGTSTGQRDWLTTRAAPVTRAAAGAQHNSDAQHRHAASESTPARLPTVPATAASAVQDSEVHQQQPALVVQQQQEGVIQDMADAADEQLQAPPQHQDSEQEYVEVEVTTEVEEEVPVRPFNAQEAVQSAGTFFTVDNVGRTLSVAGVGLLLLTLAVAVNRVYQKTNTPEEKRKRLIERNKRLVTELSKYLPDKRDQLNAGIIRGLRGSTGFTGVEVFRKYLWYVLRLRKFDHDAVEDLLALKAAAALTDAEVAEALQTRAQRVYDTYGTLMLNTEGFTTAGLERRTACKALFQKLLYLSECERLVAQGSEAAKSIDLRTIFGATEEDLEKTRLVSLFDVDLEKAFNQGLTGKILDSESEEEEQPPSSTAQEGGRPPR